MKLSGRQEIRPEQNGAEDEPDSPAASGLGLVFGSQW